MVLLNSFAQLNPLEPKPGIVADISTSNATNYELAGYCKSGNGDVTINFGTLNFVAPCNIVTGIYFLTNLDVSSETFTHPIRQCITQVPFASECSPFANNNLVTLSVLINSAPNIDTSNETNYLISGFCSEDGQAVTLNIGGITPAVQPICNLGSWNISGIDLSSLSEGAVIITADHQDSGGASAPQASISINKDSLLPQVLITSAPDITSSNESAYTVQGSCSDNTQNVILNIGGIVPSSQPICSANSWSTTIDVSSLPLGSVLITADHQDLNGNNATQASFTVSKIIPVNCSQILAADASAIDGVYTIDPDGASGNSSFQVYCDMTSQGGGWTLVLNYQER